MSPSSSGAADPRKRRNIIIGAAVAIAVVGAVVLILVSSGGSDSSNSDSTSGGSSPGQLQGTKEVSAMLDGIPQQGNVLGKKNAKVTVIEFVDLQCPICKDFSLNALPVIVDKYVRTGKVRMETRTLTFLGPNSVKAARAAAAAGQQNLEWNFNDLFYFNQGEENRTEITYVTDAFIDSLYEAAGVNVAKANAFAKTDKAAAPSQEADAEAQRYGITGTPGFVVGPTGGPYNKIEVDPTSPDGLAAAIDELLKK